MIFDVRLVLEYLGLFLLGVGCFFELSGAIGVLRFPDFYTRAHATTMTIIGGTVIPLIGVALISIAWSGLEGSHLAMICVISSVIIMITAPTGTHMIMRAALLGKLKGAKEVEQVKNRCY